MVYLKSILDLMPNETIFYLKETKLAKNAVRVSREKLENCYDVSKIMVATINAVFDDFKRAGIALVVDKIIKK